MGRRDNLAAYFAGIFDGEGYVGVQRRDGRAHGLRVVVRMNEPTPILLLKVEYPEGSLLIHRHNGVDARGVPYNQGYEWRVNQRKALRFLNDVHSFTIGKHEQVTLAKSYLAHRAKFHSNYPLRSMGKIKQDCPRCERLCSLLQAKKHEEPNGVKSVNALLDHELREYRAKREDVEQTVAEMLRLLGPLEGVETSAEGSTPNKATSAPEQEIVRPLFA